MEYVVRRAEDIIQADPTNPLCPRMELLTSATAAAAAAVEEADAGPAAAAEAAATREGAEAIDGIMW